MFEDQKEVLRQYAEHGVGVGKVQVSSAVEVDFRQVSGAACRTGKSPLVVRRRPLPAPNKRQLAGCAMPLFARSVPLRRQLAGRDRTPATLYRGQWQYTSTCPSFWTGLASSARHRRTSADVSMRPPGIRNWSILKSRRYAWSVLPPQLQRPTSLPASPGKWRWLSDLMHEAETVVEFTAPEIGETHHGERESGRVCGVSFTTADHHRRAARGVITFLMIVILFMRAHAQPLDTQAVVSIAMAALAFTAIGQTVRARTAGPIQLPEDRQGYLGFFPAAANAAACPIPMKANCCRYFSARPLSGPRSWKAERSAAWWLSCSKDKSTRLCWRSCCMLGILAPFPRATPCRNG